MLWMLINYPFQVHPDFVSLLAYIDWYAGFLQTRKKKNQQTTTLWSVVDHLLEVLQRPCWKLKVTLLKLPSWASLRWFSWVLHLQSLFSWRCWPPLPTPTLLPWEVTAAAQSVSWVAFHFINWGTRNMMLKTVPTDPSSPPSKNQMNYYYKDICKY